MCERVCVHFISYICIYMPEYDKGCIGYAANLAGLEEELGL